MDSYLGLPSNCASVCRHYYPTIRWGECEIFSPVSAIEATALTADTTTLTTTLGKSAATNDNNFCFVSHWSPEYSHATSTIKPTHSHPKFETCTPPTSAMSASSAANSVKAEAEKPMSSTNTLATDSIVNVWDMPIADAVIISETNPETNSETTTQSCVSYSIPFLFSESSCSLQCTDVFEEYAEMEWDETLGQNDMQDLESTMVQEEMQGLEVTITDLGTIFSPLTIALDPFAVMFDIGPANDRQKNLYKQPEDTIPSPSESESGNDDDAEAILPMQLETFALVLLMTIQLILLYFAIFPERFHRVSYQVLGDYDRALRGEPSYLCWPNNHPRCEWCCVAYCVASWVFLPHIVFFQALRRWYLATWVRQTPEVLVRGEESEG